MTHKLPLMALLLALVCAAPNAAAAPATTKPAPATTTKARYIPPMDINKAPKTMLLTVPGITPQVAVAILQRRPFRDRKDLMKRVSSINKGNIDAIGAYFYFSN